MAPTPHIAPSNAYLLYRSLPVVQALFRTVRVFLRKKLLTPKQVAILVQQLDYSIEKVMHSYYGPDSTFSISCDELVTHRQYNTSYDLILRGVHIYRHYSPMTVQYEMVKQDWLNTQPEDSDDSDDEDWSLAKRKRRNKRKNRSRKKRSTDECTEKHAAAIKKKLANHSVKIRITHKKLDCLRLRTYSPIRLNRDGYHIVSGIGACHVRFFKENLNPKICIYMLKPLGFALRRTQKRIKKEEPTTESKDN